MTGDDKNSADGQRRVDVVAAVMGAWGDKDIDRLLSHISPDIVWHYQVGSRPVTGLDGMRKMLDRLKDHQLDSKWRLAKWAANGDMLFIEAVDDYTNPTGHRVRAPYAGVYRFDGDLIIEWRDYVDLGLLMKGEEGQPLDEWLEPLIDAEPLAGHDRG
ncbi:MAG: nuclear transport factor 2 family protein [Actinomycetota bacterium]